MMKRTNMLRTCRFQPYRKGFGPTFTLQTWDTEHQHRGGPQWAIGYRLTMRGPCDHPDSAKTTCGRCHRSWCDDCYPAPSAMCHWCNGGDATPWKKPITTVLFEGEDFGCSPCHAIDSDACIESLMSFLTLRPGDTDAEYFADYTEAQLDYCHQHAEALSACVQARYCDENGNVKESCR